MGMLACDRCGGAMMQDRELIWLCIVCGRELYDHMPLNATAAGAAMAAQAVADGALDPKAARRRERQAQVEHALFLRAKGLTWIEIGRRFGYTAGVVRAWCESARAQTVKPAGGERERRAPHDSALHAEAMRSMDGGESVESVEARTGIERGVLVGWRRKWRESGGRTFQRTGKDDPRRIDALQAMIDGESAAAVAKRIGVSYAAVAKWRREAEAGGYTFPKRRTRTYPAAVKTQAIYLARQGATRREIAEQTGVPSDTVGSWIRGINSWRVGGRGRRKVGAEAAG